jgi:hypothetical protein
MLPLFIEIKNKKIKRGCQDGDPKVFYLDGWMGLDIDG